MSIIGGSISIFTSNLLVTWGIPTPWEIIFTSFFVELKLTLLKTKLPVCVELIKRVLLLLINKSSLAPGVVVPEISITNVLINSGI